VKEIKKVGNKNGEEIAIDVFTLIIDRFLIVPQNEISGFEE
jgi:hypothetical protein